MVPGAPVFMSPARNLGFYLPCFPLTFLNCMHDQGQPAGGDRKEAGGVCRTCWGLHLCCPGEGSLPVQAPVGSGARNPFPLFERELEAFLRPFLSRPTSALGFRCPGAQARRYRGGSLVDETLSESRGSHTFVLNVTLVSLLSGSPVMMTFPVASEGRKLHYAFHSAPAHGSEVFDRARGLNPQNLPFTCYGSRMRFSCVTW